MADELAELEALEASMPVVGEMTLMEELDSLAAFVKADPKDEVKKEAAEAAETVIIRPAAAPARKQKPAPAPAKPVAKTKDPADFSDEEPAPKKDAPVVSKFKGKLNIAQMGIPMMGMGGPGGGLAAIRKRKAEAAAKRAAEAAEAGEEPAPTPVDTGMMHVARAKPVKKKRPVNKNFAKFDAGKTIAAEVEGKEVVAISTEPKTPEKKPVAVVKKVEEPVVDVAKEKPKATPAPAPAKRPVAAAATPAPAPERKKPPAPAPPRKTEETKSSAGASAEAVALTEALGAKFGPAEVSNLKVSYENWMKTQPASTGLEELAVELNQQKLGAEALQGHFEAVKTQVRLAVKGSKDDNKAGSDEKQTFSNMLNKDLILRQVESGIYVTERLHAVSTKFTTIARKFADDWKKAVEQEQAALAKQQQKVPDYMMSTNQAYTNFLASMINMSDAANTFALHTEHTAIEDLSTFNTKATGSKKKMESTLKTLSNKLSKLLTSVNKQRLNTNKEQKKLQSEKSKYKQAQQDTTSVAKDVNKLLKSTQSQAKTALKVTTNLYRDVDAANVLRLEYNKTLLDLERVERLRMKVVTKSINAIGQHEAKFGQTLSAYGRMARQLTTNIKINNDVHQFVKVGVDADGDASNLLMIEYGVLHEPSVLDPETYPYNMDLI